jgi:hypothetical protein
MIYDPCFHCWRDPQRLKKTLPPAVRDFVKMGRKGGKIGGSMRAANMTAKERSESARRAVEARWAKRRPKT